MGVHWEGAFFEKSPIQDATRARPAAFGEMPGQYCQGEGMIGTIKELLAERRCTGKVSPEKGPTFGSGESAILGATSSEPSLSLPLAPGNSSLVRGELKYAGVQAVL